MTKVSSNAFSFYILGSTFSFSSTPTLLPDSIDIEPILKYAETNNYLSCPAPLLQIMVESFDLSDLREPSNLCAETEYKLKALLRRALSFDALQWLINFTPASPFDDFNKRFHIGSAHRSAVCIYLARFIPCTNPLLSPTSGTALVSLTGLADDIIYHISHMNPSDTLFKSISWPLFLAGAESQNYAQRRWIMNTYDSLYQVMYWGYIPTVKKVLEVIWTIKDEAPEGAPNCWVNECRDAGTEMLVA